MWPWSDNVDTQLPVLERIEDPEKLLAVILECVEQRDVRGLKTYVLEHKLRQDGLFWDLILKIGDCISHEMFENNPEFFDTCDQCLMYLANVGNPKEGLLAFLQQVDTFGVDDTKYKCFLQYVQTTLLMIPKKLFHSLDVALETVSAHIEELSLPENLELEGPEIKLFHLDEKVTRIADVLDAYLKFIEALVVKTVTSSSNDVNSSACKEALVLKKHLAQVFGHPLCYLILDYDADNDMTKSESRMCAEKALELFTKVESNVHRFMAETKTSEEPTLGDKEMKDVEEQSEDQKIADTVASWGFKMEISPPARACLAYLVHAELLGTESLPAIYTHEYMLEFHLDNLSLLLNSTNFAINYKGLLLCKSLAERVAGDALLSDMLDNPGYMALINGLIHVMTKCPVRDHRSLATRVFPTIISKFEAPARCTIYQNILATCAHSGVKGYLITLLKNDVAKSLHHCRKRKIDESEVDQHGKEMSFDCFTGNSLYRLLKLALFLPEKEKSDVLENSDQIISAINLLRFIVLADKPTFNILGVWDFMDVVDRDFIQPLRLGLELSQAHYKLERDNVREGRPSMAGGDNPGPELSVSVGGGVLPVAGKEEKLELIGKALNTHSIMTSLLCRLSELVEQQRESA